MSHDPEKMVTLGRLAAVIREPHTEVDEPKTIVLAHGLGANAWDLAPLAESIDPRSRFRWIFPNAPVSLAAIERDAAAADDAPDAVREGADDGTDVLSGDPTADLRREVGRAWFPYEPRQILNLIFGDYLRRIPDQKPASLRTSGGMLLDLIDDACERFGTRPQQFIIGGFSQGAMVATEAVFSATYAPIALLVLSGSIIDQERWTQCSRTYASRHPGARVRYFQSHGTSDPMLRYADARSLMDLLTSAGFVGEFHHFPGGHWIPEEIIWNLSEMLFDL